MEFLKGLDEQVIHRHPDWPAPVGVAAEQAGHGFRRPITDFHRVAVGVETIRLALVNFRQRTHTIVAEEFRLVEHPAEEAFHAMTAQKREQMPFALTTILPTGDQVREVGTMFKHPFQSSGESGELLQEL